MLAVSQVPLFQNNQYVEVAYFRMTYLEPFQPQYQK